MYSKFLPTLLFVFPLLGFAQPALPVSAVARQLQQYSQEARKFLDRQQPDSAFSSIKPGLPLLHQLPDTVAIVRQFRAELATIYMRRHQLQDVVSTCKPLIIVCQQTHDRLLEGRARRLLSRAYSDLGMYQECITESLRILTLFQQPPDHDMLARTYAVLAWAYEQQGDSKQATKYTWLGIRAGKLVDKPDSRVVSFLNEAAMYMKENQFDKSVQSIKSILPEINANPALAAYRLAGSQLLAEALWQANRLGEALQVANAVITKAHKDGNTTAEIAACITVAHIHAAQGNNKASATVATHTMTLATQQVPPSSRQEALRVFSEAQERVGNTAAALTATRQLAALTDSLNQLNKAEAIATAETRFDVKAKNTTISLLNANLALKQQQSQQQRQTAGLIIAVLVLGMGIVGLFWYQARKTGRILQGQKTEIETQAAQLAEVNGIKDQLFSIVSHDLRGPVMSLQQSLDRLDAASATSAFAEALPRFRQSVNAVATLTDNILCWALAQMGGLRTRPQVFGIGEVLADVLALYEEPIRQKQLRLVLPDLVTAEPDRGVVLADETQAEIALRNVVQNAIKFSPVGGQLTFALEDVPTGLTTLVVLDEGPGFDWQAGQTGASQPKTRASQSSTGLGLAVVEDLMRRSGGIVQITRRTDRSGTAVRLGWPAPQAATAVHQSAEDPALPRLM